MRGDHRPGEPLRRLRLAVAVAAAAFRIAVRERRCRFDVLVPLLRQGQPLAQPLQDPVALARFVRRLIPYLPPFGMGRCLKRSLLLLHLWSRCGLAPVLHIGVAGVGGPRRAHAWLTVEDPALVDLAGCPAGTVETVRFAARPSP